LPTGFKVVFRFLWYFISRVLIWGVAIGLIVLAFFVAMDYMNVRILTSDGLQVRAEVIIKGDDSTTLSRVFSKGFLEQDELLWSHNYRQYIVSDMNYQLDVGFVLIMPWHDTATLRVTELVTNIDAEIFEGAQTTEDISETPPPWDHATYDVKLARFEDNWRIVSMELVEMLPQPSPSPSPSPSKTKAPTPSPTAVSDVPQAEVDSE